MRVLLAAGAAAVLLTAPACSWLNRAAAIGGDPVAARPETQRAADDADSAFWIWLGLISVGATGATTAAVKHRRRKRAAAASY